MAVNRNLESANEDTVQCFFFSSSPNLQKDIDEWRVLCEKVNKTIESLSENYIWHRDEFKVYIPIDRKDNDGSGMPAHLISTTCFGDNLEDEWFIVYLILEITKQFEDLIIKITDTDGDFILIEAADYLPSWANPDSTENRVFIYRNHIHIIPPSMADTKTELTLEDGIRFVVESPEKTKAHDIQQAILKRVIDFPLRMSINIHNAVIRLPIELAAVLKLKPSLISPIVSAYCNHDMIDAKAFKNVTFNDCVNVEVKFTKYLYAMLVHSKLVNSIRKKFIKETEKKSVTGLKLTCGYQVIMSKLTEDVFLSKEFHKYLTVLKDSGYFREFIEGSVGHTQLLEKAKDFYVGTECPINSYVCNKISQLMTTDEYIALKDTLNNQSKPESDLVEDSEDWLNIEPEQLNNLLNSRYGKQSTLKEGDIISPQAITSELSNFLKQTSDFEGIETGEAKDSDNNTIEFDSEEFVHTLEKMLNMMSKGKEDMDSDVSEDHEEDITEENNDLDEELKSKLHTDEDGNSDSCKNIMLNMIRSMKEEQASSGPSSNILKTIGFNKPDLLDSDDD